MSINIKRIPFDPGRWPFFYGWMILGAGTIGMLMSIPGQTVGVSVFTDYLIKALGLPRQFLSLAYLVGTIGSALLLTRAGKLYDRFGARVIAVFVSFLLGVTLVYLSFSDTISDLLKRLLPFLGNMVPAFIIMSIGFFFIRFLGQGTLTLVSRNMVMEWFEKRRGFANAILGVSVSFGFSYSPRLMNTLIQGHGWKDAWRIIAVIVGIGFTLFAFIFFRNRPEEHGLVPDGGIVKEKKRAHAETSQAEDFTLQEARRTFTFWAFTLTLTLSALVVTAFTFHIVSIFQNSGLSRQQAVSIFFPSSLVAVGIQFLGSWASDYIKMKYLAVLQSAGITVLLMGILFLSPGLPVILIIIGSGITQGMMGVTGNVTWARFFGRKHLGAVAGFASACMVAGSAVGPYLFSLSLSDSGSYGIAAIVFAVIAVVLLFLSFGAERPKLKTEAASGNNGEQNG